ncbi:MAG: hypothetical protein A3A80_03505 [Candidatus Terrybacteria bacterium RIFCSPLOWO2_01_FULL_44_24]|uniref:Peptidase S26 domain-containing protein n=1 Tax=Candidatus Terrybacteria bacterium RIFCSPHIGHO2_01_FULL_43_35 TaxID=1802361 RepID=A0A1G2PFM7_9BACT|nr:MAG: hypothetical protein A2828_00425 [Candidatus Terrybacteria bacterium RIFCSPHIGHO2_01_FULL_43_35]OHA49784.1 MAG: hypothetical protein A3B75_02000 [Candidatus Terrybacteria bacterium RIFCSPHIGHO2_02_FULL_43_14]OHA51606.1 MAG: hypothetical protein A3A80_03505 [Candidatus Terrybacteria bacterium RIFCSPLOWO2_01_FULL_44_24]
MAPAFLKGERLVISFLPYFFGGPKIGDVVVLRHPQQKNLLLLKRINDIKDNKYTVIGDNLNGTDSRTFGLIDRKNIVGKFVAKY